MALVNHFFEKRRGVANGIATSGTGVGSLAFPPLTNYLFSQYGFGGTCMFLSGIALQGVVAGALIITPHQALKLMKTGSKRKKMTGVDNEIFTVSDAHINDINATETMKTETAEGPGTCPTKSTDKISHKTFLQVMKSAINLQLFKDYRYVCFTLTHCIFSSCVIISPAFMPARAVSYGISKTNGSLLISVMGISSMLSRPAMGFITDVQPIKGKRFYMFHTSSLLAGCLSVVSFGPSLAAQMIYASLYGVTTGMDG